MIYILNIKQLSRMERGVLPYSQCVNVSFYQTDSLSLLIITSLSCELPVGPDHGRVSFTATSFQAVASFECDYGFMMVGAATRACARTGQWTGRAPICKGERKQ